MATHWVRWEGGKAKSNKKGETKKVSLKKAQTKRKDGRLQGLQREN